MTTVPHDAATATTHALWSGTVRLLRMAASDAVANMAVDEAMLRTAAESGETLVRLYRWERPSLSFGRNQRTAGFYSAAQCAALGVPVVRRLTGGRALVHAREVTYAVAAPTSSSATLRYGYEAINALLLVALRALGIPATRAAPAERMPSPGLAPCFESPAAGELVVGGAKIVGSAQHREAGALLQHGSILLSDDQPLLRTLSLVPLPDMPPAGTLRSARPELEAADVEAALVDALRAVAPGHIVDMAVTDLPAHHVAAAETRYRDSRWTWRR